MDCQFSGRNVYELNFQCYELNRKHVKPALELATLSLNSGFDSIHCSDHFHPWNHRQGHSGMAWTWLGASMQVNDCAHGLVCAPGQRYHPAIIAQSAATLIDMFGDRLWISLGTGQALNESIAGPWPSKDVRQERLLECVDVMRRLWNGERVSHDGLVHVNNAKLYTCPPASPLLLGAALTDSTVSWVSTWADGLITVANTPEEASKKIELLRRTARDTRPVYVKIDVAFDESEDAALLGAHDQWSTNILGSPLQAELHSPEEFEDAVKDVQPEKMRECVFICTDPDAFADLVVRYFDAGITKLIIHNVTRKQQEFLHFWKSDVNPKVRAKLRANVGSSLGANPGANSGANTGANTGAANTGANSGADSRADLKRSSF